MKSRLVILTMLVLGMLLSTTGAGLAVSGLSGDNASDRQYASRPRPAAAASSATRTPAPATRPSENGGGGSPAEATNTQPARQVEAGANNSKPAVHRLRGHPGPPRRHRAAERRPGAAPPHRRRALTRTDRSELTRGGLRPASRR